MAGNTWTADRDAELTRHWREGVLSVAKIGAAMGMTPSAISGRVWRLQAQGLLAIRTKPATRGDITRQAPKPAGAPPPPQPVQKPAAIPKARDVLPIGGVRIRECQWVNGDPGKGAWRYCGADAERGRPYCADHCAKAYRGREDVA